MKLTTTIALLSALLMQIYADGLEAIIHQNRVVWSDIPAGVMPKFTQDLVTAFESGQPELDAICKASKEKPEAPKNKFMSYKVCNDAQLTKAKADLGKDQLKREAPGFVKTDQTEAFTAYHQEKYRLAVEIKRLIVKAATLYQQSEVPEVKKEAKRAFLAALQQTAENVTRIEKYMEELEEYFKPLVQDGALPHGPKPTLYLNWLAKVSVVDKDTDEKDLLEFKFGEKNDFGTLTEEQIGKFPEFPEDKPEIKEEGGEDGKEKPIIVAYSDVEESDDEIVIDLSAAVQPVVPESTPTVASITAGKESGNGAAASSGFELASALCFGFAAIALLF